MNETRPRTDHEGNDLDEDLFDFAAVMRSSDVSASEHEPGVEGEEEDLDRVLASIRDTQAGKEAARAAAAPALPARPAAAARPRSEAPHAPAPPAPPVEEPRRAEPGSGPQPSAPRRRPRGSLIAIAVGVTLLNSTLAVVVMRSPARLDLARREPASHVLPSGLQGSSAPAPEAPRRSHPALDEAWAEVARGEYASARQRAYGLLALVDGIEGAERAAIEADCRFLIAQALTLDALARREAAP